MLNIYKLQLNKGILIPKRLDAKIGEHTLVEDASGSGGIHSARICPESTMSADFQAFSTKSGALLTSIRAYILFVIVST
jgi:hypothetical protein